MERVALKTGEWNQTLQKVKAVEDLALLKYALKGLYVCMRVQWIRAVNFFQKWTLNEFRWHVCILHLNGFLKAQILLVMGLLAKGPAEAEK